MSFWSQNKQLGAGYRSQKVNLLNSQNVWASWTLYCKASPVMDSDSNKHESHMMERSLMVRRALIPPPAAILLGKEKRACLEREKKRTDWEGGKKSPQKFWCAVWLWICFSQPSLYNILKLTYMRNIQRNGVPVTIPARCLFTVWRDPACRGHQLIDPRCHGQVSNIKSG